jgi:hypothetical protein
LPIAYRTPTGNNTIEAFKESAAGASGSTSPADGLPTGGDRVLAIEVGGDKLVFSPADAGTQLPGTVVQFNFNPKVRRRRGHVRVASC